MFFENLNAFMAWMVMLALFAGKSMNTFLMSISNFICTNCIYPEVVQSSLYIGAFTLILGICWYKIGLVPSVINSMRQTRYITGHLLIAVANTVILFVFTSSFSKIILVVSMFTGILILPVLIAYPIGLLMISTAGFGNKELNQNK
jgi:hypothetical protein